MNLSEKYPNVWESGNTYEDNLLRIVFYLEEKINKQESIILNKLNEITIEYRKLDKRNLNTSNIITHQFNSMRKVLEEVLEETGKEVGNE